jgi:hypothetical protein
MASLVSRKDQQKMVDRCEPIQQSKMDQISSQPMGLASDSRALEVWETLWRHRNKILHGTTAEEQAQQLFKVLQNKVSEYHEQFSRNNMLVLPRHEYLFPAWTLEHRIRAP